MRNIPLVDQSRGGATLKMERGATIFQHSPHRQKWTIYKLKMCCIAARFELVSAIFAIFEFPHLSHTCNTSVPQMNSLDLVTLPSCFLPFLYSSITILSLSYFPSHPSPPLTHSG